MPEIFDAKTTTNNDITIISSGENNSFIMSSPNTTSETSFEKPMAKKRIKLSQEDREKLRIEKEKLRKEREQIRMAKEEQKIEREKERIEKEKQKLEREKKLREEREKKQQELQLQKQLKEKLRKEKEEERLRKELEKQKRLEEKQNIIDEENRKKELAEKIRNENLEKSRAILSNFLKKSPSCKRNSLDHSINNDSNDRGIGDDSDAIKYVPENLLNEFDPEKFECSIKEQNLSKDDLYLSSIRSGKHKPYVNSQSNDNNNNNNSQSSNNDIDDLMTDEQYQIVNYIYLKFHENVKPPYYGPKRISTEITGRCPFKKIETLDYEIDSNDEWDEGGEQGESLSNTDSEQEEKDDYEIDNDFFVPHGYLSDDESNINNDNNTNNNDNDGDDKKIRLLSKEQTFLNERSKLLPDKLVPQIIGCYWMTTDNDQQQSTIVNPEKLKILEQFKITPIPPSISIVK